MKANAQAGEVLMQLSRPQRRKLRRAGTHTSRFQRNSIRLYKKRFTDA